MRKILFRGKHKSSGKWCEGNLHIDNQDVAIITPDDTPLGCYGQVDPDTVGQFTGVVDKGGNWIFEGDIIRAVLPETKSRREFVWPLMQIIFASGAFCAWDRQREFITLKSFSPSVLFEIVGNIHDNPELMEDK